MSIFRAPSYVGVGLVFCGAALAFSACTDNGSGDTGSTMKGGSTSGGTATVAGGGGTTGGLPSGGTGGTSGGGGSGDQCASPLPVTDGFVNDFEAGIGDGTNSGAYVYTDDKSGGTFTPAMDKPEDGVVDGGANGSKKSYQFSGKDFVATSWGAGFGVWSLCSDVSQATGVKFWIKNDLPVRVAVVINADQPVMQKGKCDGMSGKCTQPGFDVAANADWTQVAIPFAKLQGGVPSKFDPKQVVGVMFSVEPPAGAKDSYSFSVSVDEVVWDGLPVTPPEGTGGAPNDTGNGGAGGAP